MNFNMGKLSAATILMLFPLLTAAFNDVDLVEAAKQGNPERMQSLLQNDSADPDIAQADGTTALHWAAHRDDLDMARALLFAEADASPANLYGVTPLQLACVNRSEPMVELLLEAGADPNARLWNGESVLMQCSLTGTTKAVADLLAAGADANARESRHGQTALMWAAGKGHPEVVNLLLDYGAEVEARTTATADRLPKTCRICEWKPDPGSFSALMFAARSGDVESARLLLEAGADPNHATAQHGNSLVIASAGGHEDLALLLLEAGADPDATDENGVTALHHSFRKAISRLHGITYDPVYRVRPENMPRLARALIEAGANVDARIVNSYRIGPAIRDRCEGLSGMQGATPFILAAMSFDVPLLRMLKQHGADPGMISEDGTTALMAATQAACTMASQRGDESNDEEVEGSLRTVQALVDMGVDINAVNPEGETALHMAAFSGAGPVVQYLVDNGARIDIRNDSGETPWSMAAGISPQFNDLGSYGVHEDTAELLLSLGATSITREQMQTPDSYGNFSDKALSIDVQNQQAVTD